ncbi:MAG: phosphotransferase family protein [Hyphomonadaceae bacterium]
MTTTGALESQVLSALQRRKLPVTGLAGMRRLTGGAMQETWRIETQAPPPFDRLILRRAPSRSEPRPGTISLAAQAHISETARKHGVPGPEVIAILDEDDGLGEGFLMTFVEGETVPQRVLRQPNLARARERLAGQCGAILAKLHDAPPAELPPLPRFTAKDKLERLHDQYLRQGRPRPVFELAFSWLRRRLPQDEPEARLVHGDFRNGNFIIGENGLVAVLDWERAFLGDPMFDAGWLCVGSWRFGAIDLPVGGFGSLADFVEAYEAAGGKFEPKRARYWEAYGILDWGVTTVDLAIEAQETQALELAAIGRRSTETEIDLIRLMRDHE